MFETHKQTKDIGHILNLGTLKKKIKKTLWLHINGIWHSYNNTQKDQN